MPLQPLHAPARVERRHTRLRLDLEDGGATTVHVAGFELSEVVPRVRVLPASMPLASWCRINAVTDAIVGGFFVRSQSVPLGELRIDGARVDSVPFARPWDGVRSCVHVVGRTVRLAPRSEIRAEPPGDLLQAGPLLVRGGEVVLDDRDPEGCSTGAAEFDSDITVGRYPRAALGIVGSTLLAAVCEGRASDEAGLTLAELARAMRTLGAEVAINLDGGGSASLVVDGRLVNRPREEHGIDIVGGRPIATAISFERV
jgi:Phosphodiester glycosidase